MNILIVYMSIHHGNTKKIANTIAETLNAELHTPNNVDPNSISQYDGIGFGSGIYYGRPHKSILQLVGESPKQPSKKAFIFSTSGLRRIPVFHNYHELLKRKLRAKGFNVIGEFSCRGFDTNGPLKLIGGIHKHRPNEQDIRNAEKFAQRLKPLFG